MENRAYICIDLKSFYASVECVERGLDPLDAFLTVADESRTDKTICLAVSPALKAYGISGRARLFELKEKLRAVNYVRRETAPNRNFTGEAFSETEASDPEKAISFIAAPPRMSLYIKKSAQIYGIYLRHIAPEDIHVYSVDEVFIDATGYIDTLRVTPREFAAKLIAEVYRETGITATAGIGTNLYLAKIAMDIEAKHVDPDERGARIAELDEQSYRERLWDHRPLTDFWRVGAGTANKLEARGIFTMGDLAQYSVLREESLYRLFGINAELLIDHAWGWEPCTMAQIKAYKPSVHGISSSQVLTEPYTSQAGRLILKEMAEALALDLCSKGLVTDSVTLTVGYDVSNLRSRRIAESYGGEVSVDRYGRAVPVHAHGSVRLKRKTSSVSEITDAFCKIYDTKVNTELFIRRMTLSADDTFDEIQAQTEPRFEQLDLFSSPSASAEESENGEKLKNERELQRTMLFIKGKFGKNAVFRGMSLCDGATGLKRNAQTGGHSN